MEQWNIAVNGKTYEIIYEGSTLTGKGKFLVENQAVRVTAIPVRKVGRFYVLIIDDSEVVLKCDLKNRPVELIQDGRYLATGAPVEEQVQQVLQNFIESADPLVAKDRAAMGSFLTFTALTYVNMLLFLIGASVTFPFSAIAPPLALELLLYDGASFDLQTVLRVLLCVALASVYLFLYWKAKKDSLWPVVVSLILVAADTLLVFYLAAYDFSYYIIDIAFHLWVLYSMIQLCRVRVLKRKQSLSEQNPAEYPPVE